MSRRVLIVAALLLVPMAYVASADDLRPPDYRFKQYSTVAGWDFIWEENLQPLKPDDPQTPLIVGDAVAALQELYPIDVGYPAASSFGELVYSPDSGGGYFKQPYGAGGLVFTIPGWLNIEPLFRQRLRVQVTHQGPAPLVKVRGYGSLSLDPAGPFEFREKSVGVADPSLPQGASFFYEDWGFRSMAPQWTQVIVYIPDETILLQVVIDTVLETDPIFDDDYED